MNPILLEIFGQGSNSDAIIIIGLVLALLQIYAIMRPNPALHRQFADKESLTEIKELLHEQIDNGRKDRRLIYSRLNRHDNALSFIAGRLERKRDHDGQELRKILTPLDPTDE